MFINSIFLPKNISDQTLPEGVAGKIGNFSHLFSNVFRIVKDEQEGTVPFQLANLSAEGTSNTQNELLKVSLLSNNKLTLENTNISMIVAAFLSKLSPAEFTEELADVNKVKINEKVPKYFSLNKNEFIKEIKNIIDSLKNGDTKTLENVEISLVANGQVIKINPLTTNVVALESWVTEQLQSNTDFEIIVKRGQKKLAVDVEPVKNEVSKNEKSFEFVSISTDEITETKSDTNINKNYVNPTSILKNLTFEENDSQQPLTALKQTYVNNEQTLKQVNPTIQNETSLTQKPNSETITPDNNTILTELKNGMKVETKLNSGTPSSINSTLHENLKNNISSNVNVIKQNRSIPASDLKSKPVLDNQEELVTKSETIAKKGNVLSDANLKLQKASSDKAVDTTFKSLNTEAKVKSNPLHSNEKLKNPETNKQALELNVYEKNQPDKKINVKSNQKITSILGNKNSIQEKIVLEDLIEKVEVKDIKINVQNGTKTGSINSPKIHDEYQAKLSPLKEIIAKTNTQTSSQIVDTKKVLFTKPELKQTVVKNALEMKSTNSENTLKDTATENPVVTKTEFSNNSIENVKAQNMPKLGGQNKLYLQNEFVENNNNVSAKNDSIKVIHSNRQIPKKNSIVEFDIKIQSEKNNLEQNKTIVSESPKPKLKAMDNPLPRKIVLTETGQEQRTTEQITKTQKVEVENLETKTLNQSKEVLKETTISKSNSQSNENNSKDIFNHKTVKDSVKENYKEISAAKINSAISRKSLETIEVNTIQDPEKNPSILKENTIIENPRTSLKESGSDVTNQESLTKNQFEVAKEKDKETVVLKSSVNPKSKVPEKTRVNIIQDSEKSTPNLKEKTIVENRNISLKEFGSDDVKAEILIKNQFEVVKENNKETVVLKSSANPTSKAPEETDVNTNKNLEKSSPNLKVKTMVENLRTSLKEFDCDDIKQENQITNRLENKNIKVDFMQRRIYSQIPKLEIIADEVQIKDVKSPVLNVELNKNENIQPIDEPLKSVQIPIEQKPKSEKQVWVKLSLEKNDNEVVSEVRKSSHQPNKITIDKSGDEMKKDFEHNNFSERESHESPKQRPNQVQVEAAQNTEVKAGNQNTSAQQDPIAGLKSEIKNEYNPLKSGIHAEETRFTSRTAEMVEKVKVISSGEMIREISKVLESGEKQSIVLRLVPKDLGSVKIILDTIDNVLTAKVEVENETVGHIIRNNVDQLKQNLLQNGVHVNSINISYHNSDQKQQGFNNHKRKNSAILPENDFEEIDEAVISKKMGYNTYEFLA